MSPRRPGPRDAALETSSASRQFSVRDSLVDRRRFLRGVAGAATLLSMPSVASCTTGEGSSAGDADRVLRAVEGGVDLGGPTVTTWSFDGRVPGKELRVRVGKPVTVRLENALPADTTVHWHGLQIANDMDGVPDITQPPVAPGSGFVYKFTPPDPGTFWLHTHVGLQLDRGLYAPLIVEDPNERGDYDHEWVLVLDDWVDGTGRTPDDVFHELEQGHSGRHNGMGDGNSHGDRHNGGGCVTQLGMHLSDVSDYPYYLINGRVRDAPEVLRAKPGQRVRLRIINAASDTMFRVALGQHRFTVTHTDGFPVQHAESRSLLLAMGERIDAVVELGDGVFPFVARPEGKQGTGLALVRTGSGQPPAPEVQPDELTVCPLFDSDLTATDDVTLDTATDRAHEAVLSGDMDTFTWKINGEVFGDHTPLPVSEGERVRLTFINNTMMPHPMHTHGHTFQVLRGNNPGPRRDTTIVPAKQRLHVRLNANNPGYWAMHCHNVYHMHAGMMTTLTYGSGG